MLMCWGDFAGYQDFVKESWNDLQVSIVMVLF